VLDPRALPIGSGSSAAAAGRAQRLTRRWREAGMAPGSLTGTGITPGCGLVGAGAGAVPALRACVAVADALAETLEEAG
jgi:hypothetical protein